MEINIHNYEIFFLDYLEGKLSPVHSAELIVFLEQHPELKAEFDNLALETLLPDSNPAFELKPFLQKSNTSLFPEINPVDEKIIDLLEGENISLTHFQWIKRLPSLNKTFEQYKLSRLTPPTIIFSEKASLKKNVFVERIRPVFRIAAVLVFAIISFSVIYMLSNQKDSNMTQLSGNVASVLPKLPFKKAVLQKSEIIEPSKNPTQNYSSRSVNQIIAKNNLFNRVQVKESIIKAPVLKSSNIEQADVIQVSLIDDYRGFYSQQFAHKMLNTPAGKVRNNAKPDAVISIADFAVKSLTGKTPSEYHQNGLLWKIADAGISSLNHITGSKIQFQREATQSGDTKHLVLGNLIEYTKK